jgi:phosphoribosylformylglycinamidine cyclo-ligase
MSMSSYAVAGVDISAAEENVRRISSHVRSTHGPQVLGDFGAFGGLFHLTDVRDPVLVASTDGVGTKVLLGIRTGHYEVLGRDLVNLSVNDVLTTGARPLFFLDYIGLHTLEHEIVERLVAGMAAACRENSCALLGGETAQLPELHAPGHFDLVGTVVGVVERAQIIDGSTVQPGDRLWGLASTGLHTNGYTLARRILTDDSHLDELMAPHPSYFATMAPLLGRVKAIAHITGGGIPGNLPRVLPEGVSAELNWGAWPVPRIFQELQELGGVPDAEMFRVFNMGLGLVFAAAPSEEFPGAMEVGRIVPRSAQRVSIKGR